MAPDDKPFDDVFPSDDDDDRQPAAEPDAALPADEDDEDTVILPPGDAAASALDTDAPDEGEAATPPQPPRIVAETPLGGTPPRRVPPPDEGDTTEEIAQTEAPATPTEAAATAAEAEAPPVEPPSPDDPTAPGTATARELRAADESAGEPPAGADTMAETEEPAVQQTPAAPEAPVLSDETVELDEHVDPDAPTLIESRGEAPAPTPDPTPESAPAPATPEPAEARARPEDWDDDLSPELASVLFAEPKDEAPPAEAAPAEGAPAEVDAWPAAAPTEAPPEPAPAPAEPVEPIELTDIEQARSLRLVAQGKGAPSPDTPLEGTVRYTRIEEPLDTEANQGQHVLEKWAFFKSGLPGLGGRVVKSVKIEVFDYADGSWAFSFERRYADGGRDRREVRANPDRTYLEREDEVSQVDPATGKRQRHQEEAALLFAPRKQEDKRGFLESILGRDDDAEATGPNIWRKPDKGERRAARKEGGEAFKTGFFARLFG